MYLFKYSRKYQPIPTPPYHNTQTYEYICLSTQTTSVRTSYPKQSVHRASQAHRKLLSFKMPLGWLTETCQKLRKDIKKNKLKKKQVCVCMTFKGKCISFLKKMSQKNFEDGVEFVRSFYNQVKLLCRLYFRNKLSCVFRADFFNLYAFYQLTCFNDFT